MSGGETSIIDLLRADGPLTGAELQEKSGLEPLQLWRRCVNHPDVDVRIIGSRYLRLDRNVEGFARLSPSIRREFLTYTLLDNSDGSGRLEERAESLASEIVRTSEAKRRLASQTIAGVVDGLSRREEIMSKACFILAGDIVYGMAHRVPRPEHSTGKLVRGSDLDVVIVTEDDIDPEARTELDDAMYQKKYFLLVSPSYREELDYLIKDLTTVTRQVGFDTFEHMVACKILDEGEFLYGSTEVFSKVMEMMNGRGISGKIAQLHQLALKRRAMAEDTLRQENGESLGSHYLNLFYTSDESDEIY